MKIRIKNHTLVFLILATLLVGFIGGMYVATQGSPISTVKVEAKPLDGAREVWTKIPAVDTRGAGVVGTLTTTIKPGRGGVSVDIDVLSYLDTQLSAKTAADVARNYTGIDTSNLDINYAFKINATVVEGGSAGAAMAVSVIAALQNKSLNSSAMITGTIEDDGSIGQVGAILEKARAAKHAGGELFLVPKGQGTTTDLRRNRECRKLGSLNYCEVRYSQKEVSVGEIAGISVAEVRNVGDAARHMVV